MTASRPSYPRLVSSALALVASAAAIAVAQTPVPQRADAPAAGGSAPTRDQIGPQARDLIQKLVTSHYPAVMQGASPVNRITFVLDKDGNYVTSKAWTDTALVLRSTRTTPAVAGGPSAQGGDDKRTYESVRMVLGAGVRGDGTRNVPASGGVRDFAAYGFPNITGDAVMHTQSAQSHAPTPLAVLVIRLKK